VTFKDDAGKLDGRHPAFAIEPTSALVERVGGRERELPGISRKNLNQEHTALVYVFHYLVGNTDWSLVTALGDEYCCHNGKLMQKDQSIYLLPYDFDLVGLVNASYAIPAEGARIEKVTERSYRGYCMEDDAPLREAILTSVALQPEIEKIFDDLPVLDEKDLEKDRKFIAKYFARAENEDRLLREFRRYCID
jgi:hypothetical protein